VRTEVTAPSAAAQKPGYGPLLGLSWAHFLNDGASNYLPGILPAVIVSLQVPVALAGTFITALLIGQSLQPVMGLWADRVGGRRVMLSGLIGTSVAGALIGLVPSYWLLLPLLLFIGVVNSMFHPQAAAGARKVSGTQAGTTMSIFLIGGEVGRGLWPLVASGVVVALGLHFTWLLVLPLLFSFPLLLRWTPTLTPKPTDAAPIRWREHLRPLSTLVAFCALRGLIVSGLSAFLPILWVQRGGSLAGGAALVTVLLVVGIVGNLSGGRIADRIGRRPVILVSAGISTLLLALFTTASGIWLWILLALVGIAIFGSVPLTVLIGQDIFPENRSMGTGFALGLSNAIGAACVSLLGLVVAHWGLEGVLWVLVAAGATAFVLAWRLSDHSR
jgi:FSR family fosmidomycin resistance protein-like MFS transporter